MLGTQILHSPRPTHVYSCLHFKWKVLSTPLSTYRDVPPGGTGVLQAWELLSHHASCPPVPVVVEPVVLLFAWSHQGHWRETTESVFERGNDPLRPWPNSFFT